MPCRREVCHGPVTAFSVSAVSSCLSAGMYPVVPGSLLSCLSGSQFIRFSPSYIFLRSASILGHFYQLLVFSSLTLLCMLSELFSAGTFRGTLLETASLLCLPSCPFHIFLCHSLNPADQQHCYSAAGQAFSLVICELVKTD